MYVQQAAELRLGAHHNINDGYFFISAVTPKYRATAVTTELDLQKKCSNGNRYKRRPCAWRMTYAPPWFLFKHTYTHTSELRTINFRIGTRTALIIRKLNLYIKIRNNIWQSHVLFVVAHFCACPRLLPITDWLERAPTQSRLLWFCFDDATFLFTQDNQTHSSNRQISEESKFIVINKRINRCPIGQGNLSAVPFVHSEPHNGSHCLSGECSMRTIEANKYIFYACV